MDMDIIGNAPSAECGCNLQLTIWSWWPLWKVMSATCHELLDEELIQQMAYNDGAGPEDHATCEKIAQVFETLLEAAPQGLTVDCDLRIDSQGRYVSLEEVGQADPQAPQYATLAPLVVDPVLLRDWIEFLRHCGGFRVC